MNNIVIIGAGQIGSAAYKLINERTRVKNAPMTLGDVISTYKLADQTFTDANVYLWDLVLRENVSHVVDVQSIDVAGLTLKLRAVQATHIINAMPFMHNEKIALAARDAGCSYIDFTEDDKMAACVQTIYSSAPHLTCAVKCGLAPGFINYVGHDLAKRIDKPTELMISVGALPRAVASSLDGAGNYNLSWSVDGLVNEYIRPCSVRMNGKELQISPLTGMQEVIIDGVKYEAAFTSGGIGSLVKELRHIPNVYYKTLRYPGHYAYVKEVVDRHAGEFAPIKKEFLNTFPFCKDDVIVVYAECIGKMNDGTLRKETFAQRFYGANDLSAIQRTTAGGGVTILELMLKGRLSGMVDHKDIPLGMFRNTETAATTYSR